MSNIEDASGERFREWEEALAPYGNDVEKFAREKELEVRKWYHDFPTWFIGKTQATYDLDEIWWNIQLGYNEENKELGLIAIGWIDTEYDVPDGRVHERRGSEKNFLAKWKKGDPINIEELLETAYDTTTSYTEKDLTIVSASITGKDGIIRPYNPHEPIL